MCSRRCATPLCSAVSCRVPTPAQTPSDTVSTESIRSVATRKPLGKVVMRTALLKMFFPVLSLSLIPPTLSSWSAKADHDDEEALASSSSIPASPAPVRQHVLLDLAEVLGQHVVALA